MKKIININLSSRLIPIEDSAYELLKGYLDSLKRHFSREEGGEEIVSDIEDRIAELFQEKLKKGVPCITDEDVNNMINVMGRPEQLEEETATEPKEKATSGEKDFPFPPPPSGSKRLMRDENDKILGGVCSGMAAYWGIDPVIVRIVTFLLIWAWGTGIILYIILWIVLPSSRSLRNPVRKRLYRNPDNKVVGGVCSGISAYLNIDPVIPRIFFVLPLLGVISSSIFKSWHWFPNVFFPLSVGFLPTLIVLYIILWISVPMAVTVAEKLEMRGEKVDLQSIANAMKDTKEEKKNELRPPVTDISPENEPLNEPVADETVKTDPATPPPPYYPYDPPKRHSSAGKVIITLFKIVAYLILGLVVAGLCIALVATAGGFIGAATFSSMFMPYRGFILHSSLQHTLAWPAILLTLGIPVVAIIWLLIKLFTGFRPKSALVGVSLFILWIAGLICAIWLSVSIARDFKMNYRESSKIAIEQPDGNKLLLSRQASNISISGWNFLDNMIELSEDTMILKTMRLAIQKSKDDSFHIILVRASNGNSVRQARQFVNEIHLTPSQDDSMLYIPDGFSLAPGTTFRNQHVILRVYVPVGKQIRIDNNLRRMRHYRGWNGALDDDDNYWNSENEYDWDYNKNYEMTNDGLKEVNELTPTDSTESPAVEKDSAETPYRYQSRHQAITAPKPDNFNS